MRFVVCFLALGLALPCASASTKKILKAPKVNPVKQNLVYPDGRLFHHAGCAKLPPGTQGITKEQAKLKKLHACPVCKNHKT